MNLTKHKHDIRTCLFCVLFVFWRRPYFAQENGGTAEKTSFSIALESLELLPSEINP